MTPPIELNDRFKHALDVMEHTRRNVFVTGKAGTGKSTLLDYFRNTTKRNVVVLAPTGVAAVNVRGQTIHSFFRFRPDITPATVKKFKAKKDKTIYQKIDAVIIDEISMVRADLLDCVDRFLRLNARDPRVPFGGLQMLFIGDLYQLPPVVTSHERDIFRTQYSSPYFFDAKVFGAGFELEFIELEKIYRQKDARFVELLNTVRNNTATETELAILNRRVQPPPSDTSRDSYIHLTTTNQRAREINDHRLAHLKGKTFRYHGRISGEFELKNLPADMDLTLKIGAQIMLLNNDSAGRWINGTIGKVMGFEQGRDNDPDEVIVKLPGGAEVAVTPYEWDIFNFAWNEEAQHLESEVLGSFVQVPIKLAWAVTIHKSQGKTFDKVILDLDRGTFAHGQLYVALSRCTSMEGMIFTRPLQKKDILMDWRVVNYMTHYHYALSERALPLNEKVKIIEKAIAGDGELEMVYLKASDEKSRRVIRPQRVGEMTYMDKSFLGVAGLDSMRGGERTFRVDRILELKEL